ncbi:DUF262 domain-containing protein [Corynebacterium sp. Marseille-P4321]|uniref:DUF262 domain-containing protein n=1 Tax=Corynebacterium sp. Marseille-P4321 TaxID=2736603 RepID=UPI001589B0B3|nr:DUF262 domain-containing protein [Corynebacterium sp. Marseille-P4321]
MKGTTNPILNAFDGNHKTLFIPVYQRNYDWQIKQCERLFQDLEEIIEKDRPKHFFGAVVGKPEGSWQWVVIDGQQRLTTVSILMLALANALRAGEIESDDDELAQKIELDYLRVGSNKDETKFKLKPVKDDDAAYRRLFGPEKEFVDGSNITENYRYFRQRLAKTPFTADQIWDAIRALEVMHLDLEAYDDAQRIFESLNSTGLELKEADKIRNFVLMGHDSKTQTRLYEERWNPIEENSGFETDAFIRWYLTTKTSSTPKEQDVYEAFKGYVAKRDLKTEDVLGDLYEYSGYFKKLKNAATGNASVDRLLARMNPIRGAVTVPFLMPLLREVENGETSYDDFYKVLKTIESYITRRFVVGIATNALNKIFATAFSEVSKLRTDSQPYAEVFAYSLLRRTGSGRFPSDAEFREAFSTKNMYALRAAWRDYIFDVLENGDSNDVRDISRALQNGDISIEHIMPQTLTPAWKEELGPDADEIHEIWLNRIGNLTVTGYNSSYSNAPFERKKTMQDGLNGTPYRLNDMVKTADSWGVEEMRERTEAFTEKALKYWIAPTTTFEPPAAVLPTEPMGDEGSFKGREIVSFQIGDFHQTVESWAEMVRVLLAHLVREHRSEILGYVKDYGPLKIIRAQEETPAEWRRVDESLIVFTATNTDSKISFLRGLFDHLGIENDELVFTLRALKGAAITQADTQGSAEADGDERSANKYAPITKYLDEFDQAESLKGPLDSTMELRKQFAEDFAAFAPENPASLLGGTPIGDYLASRNPAEASEVEALAVISQILAAASVLGQGYTHNRIVDGTLSAWVLRLAE